MKFEYKPNCQSVADALNVSEEREAEIKEWLDKLIHAEDADVVMEELNKADLPLNEFIIANQIIGATVMMILLTDDMEDDDTETVEFEEIKSKLNETPA